MVVVAERDQKATAGVDVAELYAGQAGRVRRLVRTGVRAAEPVIDDACQTAWTRLVCHRARVCPDAAVSWLVTTALREAFRLTRCTARELSLEELLEQAGELPTAQTPPLEETAELRARLDTVRLLPERQQRLVWLQGLGFSYPEITARTGATSRTIDRQLVRARRRLRTAS